MVSTIVRAEGSLAWFQAAQIADIESSLLLLALEEVWGAGWEYAKSRLNWQVCRPSIQTPL